MLVLCPLRCLALGRAVAHAAAAPTLLELAAAGAAGGAAVGALLARPLGRSSSSTCWCWCWSPCRSHPSPSCLRGLRLLLVLLLLPQLVPVQLPLVPVVWPLRHSCTLPSREDHRRGTAGLASSCGPPTCVAARPLLRLLLPLALLPAPTRRLLKCCHPLRGAAGHCGCLATLVLQQPLGMACRCHQRQHTRPHSLAQVHDTHCSRNRAAVAVST